MCLLTTPNNFTLKNFDSNNFFLIFKKKHLYGYNSYSIDHIALNTKNTWEKSRSLDEKKRNTAQGKITEDFFLELIEYGNTLFDRRLVYTSYDSFRNDLFKNHAPIDGLLCESSNLKLQDIKNLILDDLSQSKASKLSDEMLDLCRKNKIYTVEIKSSKVPSRCYRVGENGQDISENYSEFVKSRHQESLLRSLNRLDYFKYPKYNRDMAAIIRNSCEYLNWVRSEECLGRVNASNEDILKAEYQSTLDIHTRIFTDFNTTDSYICYVFGYAIRDEFYRNFNVQNFFSNKSKNSLYVTSPINQSNKFFEIFTDSRLW